ncbi:MAG: hypothetical protein LQ350_008679 [Teloschistes chrysophthalmus]|nr:MAG: hypothetical protein LQ350_008679 [Niorma chrysophthalma]
MAHPEIQTDVAHIFDSILALKTHYDSQTYNEALGTLERMIQQERINLNAPLPVPSGTVASLSVLYNQTRARPEQRQVKSLFFSTGSPSDNASNDSHFVNYTESPEQVDDILGTDDAATRSLPVDGDQSTEDGMTSKAEPVDENFTSQNDQPEFFMAALDHESASNGPSESLGPDLSANDEGSIDRSADSTAEHTISTQSPPKDQETQFLSTSSASNSLSANNDTLIGVSTGRMLVFIPKAS